MKIFDFTNGVKGKFLADSPLISGQTGWFVTKGDAKFKVTLANAPRGWDWANSAHIRNVPIDPAKFGVGAICCCWGQSTHDNLWRWVVVGTPEWNKEACKSGILVATKV